MKYGFTNPRQQLQKVGLLRQIAVDAAILLSC